MGKFDGTFETCDRFEIIPFTVEKCKQIYGLLPIDILKVDTLKLIYTVKLENIETGLLK